MKNKKFLIFSILVLFTIVLGISYAYFSASITGLESTSTIVFDSGTLGIVYADGDSTITMNGIYPRDEALAVKDFTVTGNNTTNLVMPYKLNSR